MQKSRHIAVSASHRAGSASRDLWTERSLDEGRHGSANRGAPSDTHVHTRTMRITFAAIPAYGHVIPMVPLAHAAAAAGHDVELGADATFCDAVGLPSVEIVPPGLTLHDAEEQAKAEAETRHDLMAFVTALFGSVMPRYVTPRLLQHWDNTGRPDLLVHEGSNIGAAIAAQQAGVPSVAFHINLSPPLYFAGILRRAVDYPLDVLVDPRPQTWRGDLDEPLERLPIRTSAWSDPRATTPAWLGQPADTADTAGPTAYLTLGTVAFGAVEALRRSILETAERCARVLVAAGPDADLAALGDLPDHVQVERYVDQPAVLEHVDVAVHHGGTGTVLGCLAAGVPQVITPQGADQFMNADRLTALDLGCAVPNEAPDGSVGAAVDRLLTDEALRRRVDAVRDEIAAMPSPGEVVASLAERYAP